MSQNIPNVFNQAMEKANISKCLLGSNYLIDFSRCLGVTNLGFIISRAATPTPKK